MKLKTSMVFLGTLSMSFVAHGQSKVSLSGTADLYAQRSTGSLTSRSALSSGGNSTSKLIFRGEEDLGDGLKAGFWLEAGFALDSGSGQTTNTNNTPAGVTPVGGLTFNRRSIVYLGGRWGEIHLGRDWSPSYDVFTTKYDFFNVGSGIGLNYGSSKDRDQVRVSNDVAYITPRFAGFSLNVQHWFGEGSSGTATAKDGGGDGIRLNYDNGPVGAVISYARNNFDAGNGFYKNAAIVYDFGFMKLSGNVNWIRQAEITQKGFLIGTFIPVGLGDIKATYSQLETNGDNNPKGRKIALGYVYNLSKRTAVYTTVAQINNSNGATFAIAGATTGPNERSRGFDLGIRHQF